MVVLKSLGLLMLVMFAGVPVPFAFLTSAFYFYITGDYSSSFLIPSGASKMGSVILFCIPMFILSGGIIERGKIGDQLVGLVENLANKVKGGLGVVSVIACAMFGSVTGSGSATLSCIGSIMFPKLEEAGYPRGHSAALLGSASVLGMLIPPSGIMIIYAWLGSQSVLACFLSTVIPGLILMALFSIINCFLLRKDSNVTHNIVNLKTSRKKKLEAIPALLLPIIVLGSIYTGIMTPTEASGIAVFYATLIGVLFYKTITWSVLKESIISSAITTGSIMFMLFCIMILSRVYIMEDLPTRILELLQSISDNKYVLLLLINMFMIIIGMLMDDVSAVLLCTPLLVPIITEIGVHPVHFAAILGVNLGMGNVTPPCAPLLYLSGSLGNASIDQMMKPTLCLIFFGWLPVLALTTLFPMLSLYLPKLILGI
jgi:tripartite ATP-independent transporter DctM subunit